MGASLLAVAKYIYYRIAFRVATKNHLVFHNYSSSPNGL